MEQIRMHGAQNMKQRPMSPPKNAIPKKEEILFVVFRLLGLI